MALTISSNFESFRAPIACERIIQINNTNCRRAKRATSDQLIWISILFQPFHNAFHIPHCANSVRPSVNLGQTNDSDGINAANNIFWRERIKKQYSKGANVINKELFKPMVRRILIVRDRTPLVLRGKRRLRYTHALHHSRNSTFYVAFLYSNNFSIIVVQFKYQQSTMEDTVKEEPVDFDFSIPNQSNAPVQPVSSHSAFFIRNKSLSRYSTIRRQSRMKWSKSLRTITKFSRL